MNKTLTSKLPTALPSGAVTNEHSTFVEDLLLFQISAGVLAMVCFAANSAMGAAALYSRRPRTANRAKTILFISQATAGILSPLSFVYPSQLCKLRYSSSVPTATLEYLTSYSSCFSTSTMSIIISTMSPVAHTLLLTLDLYLPLIDCQLAWQHWALLAGVAWIIILTLSFLPWFGWNSWHGLCYIPSTWTANYSGMISMLIIMQVMACCYMLLGAFIRSRAGKEPLTEEENVPHKQLRPKVPPWEAKARFASLLVLLFCDMPLLLHILVHSDLISAGEARPILQMAWMAKHDTMLPWAVLISMFSSALLPPLTIAADPVLSASIVIMAHRAWCCRPRYVRASRHPPRRHNAVGPATTDWERASPP